MRNKLTPEHHNLCPTARLGWSMVVAIREDFYGAAL